MPGTHISHADCERVIEVLKTAFVQGRLTHEEFGARVGQAFTSQTDAELAEVTADLPAGLMGVRVPRQRAGTRPQVSVTAALSAGAFTMLAALLGMLAAVVSSSGIGLIIAVVCIAIVGVLAFGAIMVASWRAHRDEFGGDASSGLSGL